MRIYISADIEGVAGTASWDETSGAKPDYALFAAQMTSEVKAACEGAMKAGAGEIYIKDAHGSGRNINAAELPLCTRLIRSWSGHPFFMMQELDESFDAVLLIGYHSMAGSGGNPLAHTISSANIDYIKINGEYASELLINSYIASMVGVPVVFVSGDSEICEHAQKLNADIKTVPVKQGIGNSVNTMHPVLAANMIRQGVEESLKADCTRCRILLPDSFRVEISYKHHYDAYRAAFYLGVEQISPECIFYETDNYFEVLRMLMFVI